MKIQVKINQAYDVTYKRMVLYDILEDTVLFIASKEAIARLGSAGVEMLAKEIAKLGLIITFEGPDPVDTHEQIDNGFEPAPLYERPTCVVCGDPMYIETPRTGDEFWYCERCGTVQ